MSNLNINIKNALEIVRSAIQKSNSDKNSNRFFPADHRGSDWHGGETQEAIQNAEDRLLGALESGDDTLYDGLINPKTGMPYTEAEKAEAIQNAINREINAIESNRPIHPTGQERLNELRARLEAGREPNEDSSSDSDNKDTTISMADDDDGIRVEHEMFNEENAVYSDEWGNDNANASVDVLGYEANGGAFTEFGPDEIEVGAYASGSAHVVQGEANVEAGPLNAGAEGSVGAQASAEANLEVDPSDGTVQLEAGVNAFLGVKVELSGSADLGVAEVEAGIEARAGVGADAELDFGLEDGKLDLDAEAGIAFGKGIGGNFGVSVDLGAVGEVAEETHNGFYRSKWFDPRSYLG